MTKLIKNSFITTIFILPFLFSFSTSELFEFPKIIFLYFSTGLLTTFHLINFCLGKTKLFKKTNLTIPLILFLLSQIISTIFSIDPHMSFWGYYSRFNGGLLSTICYILIYQIVIIYTDNKFTQKVIKTTIISGFFISLYAIAQHFGIDKNIWIQDVQARVFSTFGQPNWLAAYLIICLSLLLGQIHQNISKENSYRPFLNLSLLAIFYTSILFTKSKSGIIATSIPVLFFSLTSLQKNFFKTTPILIILISITLLFDNPIKDKLLPKKLKDNQLKIENYKLEINNITPSQDIRYIVWQGAIDLFKKFPLIGTGVETFGISYYWTRPIAHNLTSEWDFLYNKAHNEFLNIAATTGSLGIVTYLVLIIFSILTLKQTPYLLIAYLTILVTNFAGFSVVVTSLYFFFLPALIQNQYHQDQTSLPTKKIIIIPTVILSIIFQLSILSIFLADIAYSKSKKTYQQNLSFSLKSIKVALALRPKEPQFLIQQADILSQIAIAKNDTKYVTPAIKSLSMAETISPFHLNYLKKSAQILFNLSNLDQNYLQIAINTIKKATILAPTDAKSFYILGQFYQNYNQFNQAILAYNQAVSLKSNYDHAYFQLGLIHYQQKDYPQALENFQKVIDIAPKNKDARDYIEEINDKKQ